MRTVRLDELTSAEVAGVTAAQERKFGVLLPVGCTEQHGPEVPLGCDTAIARGAAQNLAHALAAHLRYGAVVMPDFAYTPSPGVEAVAGTVSVSFEWMGAGIKEVLSAAARTPWAFAAIVNGHAHNHGRVIEASMAGAQAPPGRRFPVVVINIYDYAAQARGAGINPGSHAGEFEIALYHYYAGLSTPESGDTVWNPPRPRPPNIFGLDLMPRSHGGVISDAKPDRARALRKSREIGEIVDHSVLATLESNLDVYFAEWASQCERPGSA